MWRFQGSAAELKAQATWKTRRNVSTPLLKRSFKTNPYSIRNQTIRVIVQNQ